MPTTSLALLACATAVRQVDQEAWFVVIASSEAVAVRVLYCSPGEALGFARWMQAAGWRVRAERTNARCPSALGRTRDEEDLALGLTIAYEKWARAARPPRLSEAPRTLRVAQ